MFNWWRDNNLKSAWINMLHYFKLWLQLWGMTISFTPIFLHMEANMEDIHCQSPWMVSGRIKWTRIIHIQKTLMAWTKIYLQRLENRTALLMIGRESAFAYMATHQDVLESGYNLNNQNKRTHCTIASFKY